MSDSDGVDEDGDDSDAELQALCGTEANKKFKNLKILTSMFNTNIARWTLSGQQLPSLPQIATWHQLI